MVMKDKDGNDHWSLCPCHGTAGQAWAEISAAPEQSQSHSQLGTASLQLEQRRQRGNRGFAGSHRVEAERGAGSHRVKLWYREVKCLRSYSGTTAD